MVKFVDIKIDLKVGEYVRLKHWGISKCIKIENGLYTFDKLSINEGSEVKRRYEVIW